MKDSRSPCANTQCQKHIADLTNGLMHAPQKSAALILQYEFTATSIGHVTARVDTTYSSERAFHVLLHTFDSVNSYNLVNARLTLSEIPLVPQGNLRVSLWGKNLGDKEYREFGIDFSSLGFAVNTYGQERSAGLDIIYEY